MPVARAAEGTAPPWTNRKGCPMYNLPRLRRALGEPLFLRHEAERKGKASEPARRVCRRGLAALVVCAVYLAGPSVALAAEPPLEAPLAAHDLPALWQALAEPDGARALAAVGHLV